MKHSNVKIFTTFIYLLLLILILGSAAFLIFQRSRLIKEAQGYAIQIVEHISNSYIENGSFTAKGFADDVKEAMQNFGDLIQAVTIIDSQNVMQNRFRFDSIDPEKDSNPNWQNELAYKYNSFLYQERTYPLNLPGQTSANVKILYKQLPSQLLRSVLQFDTVFILALLILSFLAFLVIPKRDPDKTAWALQSVSEEDTGYDETEELELSQALIEENVEDLPEDFPTHHDTDDTLDEDAELAEITEIDWEEESFSMSNELDALAEELVASEETDDAIQEDENYDADSLQDEASEETNRIVPNDAVFSDEVVDENLDESLEMDDDIFPITEDNDDNLAPIETVTESVNPSSILDDPNQENSELDLLLSEAIQEIDEQDQLVATVSEPSEENQDDELLDLDEGLEEEELNIFSQIAATASLAAEEQTTEIFASAEQKIEALNWLGDFLGSREAENHTGEISLALLELPKDNIETVRSSFEQDLGDKAAFMPHEKGLIVALPNDNFGQGVAELQGAAGRLPSAYLSNLKMGITGVSAERQGIEPDTVLSEMQYALANSDRNNNISIFDTNDQVFNWQRNNT